MRVLKLPGVFRPISDSWMLVDALRRETLPPRAKTLDLCTGSGLLAVAAACRGARDVTAIDVSRKALLSAQLNARLNGQRIRTLRGDLFAPVHGERFDAITSNPPYVPAPTDELPTKGLARAWDGGVDGRLLLDRILDEAPAHLKPGGFLLVTHSTLIGLDKTVAAMEAGGLEADVVARQRGPLGPLLSARVDLLRERGMLPEGSKEEEVVIVRGRKPRRVSGVRPTAEPATIAS